MYGLACHRAHNPSLHPLPCVSLCLCTSTVCVWGGVKENSISIAFLKFIFMFMGVLPTCICTTRIQCHQRPGEGGGFPDTGVTGGHVLPRVC